MNRVCRCQHREIDTPGSAVCIAAAGQRNWIDGWAIYER